MNAQIPALAVRLTRTMAVFNVCTTKTAERRRCMMRGPQVKGNLHA